MQEALFERAFKTSPGGIQAFPITGSHNNGLDEDAREKRLRSFQSGRYLHMNKP